MSRLPPASSGSAARQTPVAAAFSGVAARARRLPREFWAGVLLVAATVLAYLPSLSGRFIWNDADYVTAPALRSLDGLRAIWFELGATQQYYPLLHSAFWLQQWIFGDNPLGYHVVNVLLHAGAAILFARLLRRLAVPGAWLAALLFALHPVHVESVAWITEQKNTLSLVLYLAAALAWLRFDETRRPRAYAVALAWFVLSILCKTVTATLPAALLVVAWWRRGRLEWRRDVRPLLPWLAIGLAGGLFSSWVERRYLGAEGGNFDLPLLERALVAGRAVWFYLGQLAWPAELNFIYPRWKPDAAVWWQWLFPLGVAALAGWLWTLRRRTRAPLAVLLLFVGSLFPVLGFVNLFGALYSWVWDHWQYLADLAPLALVAAALTRGWERLAVPRPAAGPALAAALALLLGALTWRHGAMFGDNETLFRTTIARNPAAWMAYNNLGSELTRAGRHEEAVPLFEKAVSLDPGNPALFNNLGMSLARAGDFERGLALLEEAVRIDPKVARIECNLGLALGLAGRPADALPHLRRAIELAPRLTEAHTGLGVALSQLGRHEEAIPVLRRALAINPRDAEALRDLAANLETTGRPAEAIALFERALAADPRFVEGRLGFGALLARNGRMPEARAQFEQALRFDPRSAEAHRALGFAFAQEQHYEAALPHFAAAAELRPASVEALVNLGTVQRQLGQTGAAAAAFERALALDPQNPATLNKLATLLQAQGRTTEAIERLEQAARLAPDSPLVVLNLAAALASGGRWAEAVARLEHLVRVAPGSAEAHFNLALALHEAGRGDEARAHYATARRLDPHTPDVPELR